MENEKLVAVGIRPGELTIEPVEIDDDCKAFAKWIGCDLVDFAVRFVDEVEYDFVVDDEGLLKDNPLPCTIDKDNLPCLAGNALIFRAKYDEERGRVLQSVTEGDIEFLKAHGMIARWGHKDALDGCLIAVIRNVNYFPVEDE